MTRRSRRPAARAGAVGPCQECQGRGWVLVHRCMSFAECRRKAGGCPRKEVCMGCLGLGSWLEIGADPAGAAARFCDQVAAAGREQGWDPELVETAMKHAREYRNLSQKRGGH